MEVRPQDPHLTARIQLSNLNIPASSEGVQVGGVRSLYGFLGIWSSVEHDVNDPVGTSILHYGTASRRSRALD